jgi:hypothetical protein
VAHNDLGRPRPGASHFGHPRFTGTPQLGAAGGDAPPGLRAIAARPQDSFGDEPLEPLEPLPRMQMQMQSDTFRPVSAVRPASPVATTRVQEAASDRRWMLIAAGLIVAFGVVGAVVNLNGAAPAPRANAGMGAPATAIATATATATGARMPLPPRQGVLPSASAHANATPSAHASAHANASAFPREDGTARLPAHKPPRAKRATDTSEVPATDTSGGNAPQPPAAPGTSAKKAAEPDTKPADTETKQKAMDTLEKAMSETSL